MFDGSRFFFVAALALLFAGCAMTSSGNFVGEAGALKYSTDEKKYRFAEAGLSVGGNDAYRLYSPNHETGLAGGAVHFRAELFSLDYSLLGNRGGIFFSVPVTIPLDAGIRPSIVQWVGPFYGGAGVSFVGGFYPNLQDDDYEPKADDSWGRFDGFILYSLGGGFLLDVTEKFSLGAYMTWERVAFNSGGDVYKNYGFYLDILDDTHGEENLPAYSSRKMLTTIGVQAFARFKRPLGFYLEYAPGDLFQNNSAWKLKSGVILLY
ncbi:hypothetical protein [Fibrobacter intestinalis]|uniref:hypothetical protein n=1 Tax=Fibrobacter sp. NR9 TaxID=1896200 RepID=UPI000BB0F476|nr:hypothetical protein [Fibrobacter sp. NR9]PBC73298.1 hypothetical protein BGW94_0898 [Fibrobacter sp. NR9]